MPVSISHSHSLQSLHATYRLAAVLVGLAIADLRTGAALSSTPGRCDRQYNPYNNPYIRSRKRRTASSQFDTFNFKTFGEGIVLGSRGRDQREEDGQREHCRGICSIYSNGLQNSDG